MCKDCLRREFPERRFPTVIAKDHDKLEWEFLNYQLLTDTDWPKDSTCLESGAYFLNFLCCAECRQKDVLQMQNREEHEEDDGQQIVTYQHICENCSHLIAEHEYRFQVEDDFQLYEMYCMLCGQGEDTRSIMPTDPRQQPFF